MERAIAELDDALHDPSGVPGWAEAMQTGLFDLKEAIAGHIGEVEGDDGILDDVMDTAPFLENRVKTLVADHAHLLDLCDFALQTVPESSEIDESVARVLRLRVNTLLGALSQHRQVGAELVYDAYNVDITEGD